MVVITDLEDDKSSKLSETKTVNHEVETLKGVALDYLSVEEKITIVTDSSEDSFDDESDTSEDIDANGHVVSDEDCDSSSAADSDDEDVESNENEDVEDDTSDCDDGGDDDDDDSARDKTSKPSRMDIVKDVLEKAAREAERNKSIDVSKHLSVEYDLGTLLVADTNELEFDLLRDSKEEYLKNLARDNTQLLINHIWQLPITRQDTEILAKLPSPSSVLPREKPIPKPKLMTKWEKFAQEKGIRKKRRGHLQWDETLQKWVPWWGYRRADAEKQKNWAIEVRQNDDPYEDPYAKKKVEKQERVAKNEYQRLRNLASAKNVKIPRTEGKKKVQSKLKIPRPEGNKQVQSKMMGEQQSIRGRERSKNKKQPGKGKNKEVPRMGFLTSDKMNSVQIKQAITISKASTASLGKFQSQLPKEKVARNVNALLPMAKKRRTPFLNSHQERNSNLGIIDGILNKKPKLDVEKAVNRHIYQEQRQRADEKTQRPKGKGRGKRSGGKGNAKKGRGQGKVRMGGKASSRKGGAKRKSAGGKKR